MRPFRISRSTTSTTTLRRGEESAAIDVPPALLIKIASRPAPNARPGPLPGAYTVIRTAQERARYLPGLVDRHVHNVRQPVDGTGEIVRRPVDGEARKPGPARALRCGQPARSCG